MIVVPIGLVYSIYDSTEEAIKKMIESGQGKLFLDNEGGGLNTTTKTLYELQMMTLQNSPSSGSLENVLKAKESKIRRHFTCRIMTN